jgi:hypothetical protein
MVKTKKHYQNRTKTRRAKYGGKKRSRSQKKNKRSHNWHQKGCQSGGGSMTGGVAWAPSDLTHQTAGSKLGGDIEPYAANGNHYALNSDTMIRPQNSNHLVEKSQSGGKRKYSRTQKHGKKSHHRKFIGEQRGGMAQLLPELINLEVRNATSIPGSVASSLQGASTSFVSPSVTTQPIGEPLKI